MILAVMSSSSLMTIRSLLVMVVPRYNIIMVKSTASIVMVNMYSIRILAPESSLVNDLMMTTLR